MKNVISFQQNLVNYLSWTIALGSMLLSLVFSELLRYPPCTLCWYQRILMYPLVIIIPIGILSKDRNVARYVLALSLIGFLVAIYHTLIYHGLINEPLKLCNADLSCKTKQFELFNWLSIPLMSAGSFFVILIFNLVGVFRVKRS